MTRQAFVEQIMGLPVSVHVRGPGADSPAAANAVVGAFAELRAMDAVFSPYRPDSQLSALNRGEPVHDPLVDVVIDLCEQARQRTGGYFNAYLPDPGGGTRFDPSGLVKGWAVERAAGHLEGYTFYLNAGGDMTTRGSWRVGVEDPVQPDQLLTTIEVVDGASRPRAAHTAERISSIRTPAPPPRAYARSPSSARP